MYNNNIQYYAYGKIMTNTFVKKKLLGKAFYTDYSLTKDGKMLKKWEAKHLDADKYLIKRCDGTELTVRLGDVIPKAGEVSVSDNSVLNVGEYRVLLGTNISQELTAKKLRKKGEYLIYKTGEGKRTFKALVGDNIYGLGKLSGLDEYGNLKINDLSIPVLKKNMELKLLIYNEKNSKFKTGYKCHFNLIEPGKTSNGKDGIAGVFFPQFNRSPAKFCELDKEGHTYQTAVFWPSKDKQFVTGNIRTLDDAKLEKALVETVKKIEQEAKDFGIEPDEHFDYIQAKKALDNANKKWKSYIFTVMDCPKIFGLEERAEYAYSR